MAKKLTPLAVLAAFFCILSLTGCKKEDPTPEQEGQPDPELVKQLGIELVDSIGYVSPIGLSTTDTTDHFNLHGEEPAATVETPEAIRLHFFGWSEDEDYRFKLKFPAEGDYRRCILSYTMCGWNQGPAAWDMLTEIFIKNPQTQEWYELERAITPYGGNMNINWNRTYRMDVSYLLPMLMQQDSVEFKIYYGGWDATDTRAHAVKLAFNLYKGQETDPKVIFQQKVYDSFTSGNNGYRAWAYGVQGYSIEDGSRLGVRTIKVPAGVKTLLLRACFTGHGQELLNEKGDDYATTSGYYPNRADTTSVSAAEFDENWYTLKINGVAIERRGHIWKNNSSNYWQAGTYKLNRAGWGPGNPANVHYWLITNIPAEGATLSVDMDLDEYVSNRAKPDAGYVANYYVMVDAFGLDR